MKHEWRVARGPLGEPRAEAEHEARKRSPARTKSAFVDAPKKASSLSTLIPFSFARDLQLKVASAMPFAFEERVDSGEKPTLVDMEEFGEAREEA